MKLVDEQKLIATPPLDEEYQREADPWLEVFSIFIHDIESPLASIKYLLRLLQEGHLDIQKPLHRKLVDSSKVAITRAESILYDIMAVARAGRAGVPVEIETVDLGELISEAIQLVTGSTEERGIEVNASNKAGRTKVEADPRLLVRVLDNLLYNAVRHTPDRGKIDVYTDVGEESVFIHVKDSGPGLGGIDHEQLFEKYGQIQLRSEGEHRGVGLGLYFCKLAAIGMGGTIMADDHPDGGAVFSVKLKKAGA